MYPTYKEVPVEVLEALLAHPDDARANDALLFVTTDETADWSEVTVRCVLPDDVLADRFASAVLLVDVEHRRRYGAFDLGKYPDWETDVAFRHFVGIGDVDQDVDLTGVLEPELPEDQEIARWAALGVEPVRFRTGRVTHQTESGLDQCGFSTDVVCYGISGYRCRNELAAVWSWILAALARSGVHRARVLERFEQELRYYQGCAARRSADLYLVW